MKVNFELGELKLNGRCTSSEGVIELKNLEMEVEIENFKEIMQIISDFKKDYSRESLNAHHRKFKRGE